MGKEKRTPHRADGVANHGGTPYDRPSARGGRGRTAQSGGTGPAGRGDLQASNNSLQGLAEDHGQRDRPGQTSIWRSLVSTPLRALKSTYTILLGSPNEETGAQPQDGPAGPREASSTAAVIADGPLDYQENVGDRTSLMENESMTSQPDGNLQPPSPQGASPAISEAPGTGDAFTGDRGSEYDSIRAQSASLMVQTPISSSPFLNRRKPGSAQSSGAQLGHALGPPGRLSLGPGNLSRFAQLEASPTPSPLALTPAVKPQRTAPRASRPFGKTPLRMPLAGGSGEGRSRSPEPEPPPLAWTPMRAAAMTPQTGGLRGFGLKRMREGEGTPSTPLLAAGHASEAARRIRQRSDQASFWAVGSAERRVWRAGATPFPGRPGSAGGSPGAAGPAPSRLSAPSREPMPMTESAQRIAQALDAMTKQNSSPIAPSRSQPGPPPTHTLGAFPAAAAASQGGQRSQQKPLLLGPSAGSLPAAPSAAAAASPAAHKAQPPAASSPWGAAAKGAQRPKESGPPSLGLWGQFSQPPAAASGSARTSTPTPSWGLSSPAPDNGAMDTPKFTFRPSRPLSDSAEKLRQQLQRQKEGGNAVQSVPQPDQTPAASEAAALNAKAAEAAAQPLPDSEDSDDDALGDVKGIMRTGPQKENGAILKKPQQEIRPAAAPAASGWGADFLKQNAAAQASASAAVEKEIEEKHAGKAASAMPSFGNAFAAPGQSAEKSVPGKSEPAPVMGWGADFLKKNKELEAEASAAVAAAIEEAEGAAKGPPASSPWTFGKPAPDLQSSAGGASSGLLGFLGSITPGAPASGFAPSTSSGFNLSSMTSAGAAAAPGSFPTGDQGASPFPALRLPSADGKAAQESSAPAAQTEDGPVKKKRGRGGDDAEADSAPPSKGFSFGAAAPAFGAASKDSKASADAGKAGTEVSMPPGGLSFGASQPFSFGAAATAGSTAAEGKADAKESQPGQDNASSQPAAVPAASQAAALLPASLAFGTRPADAASDGKLNATATPFAPSFDAGSMPSSDISGVQKIVAGGEAGNSQSGPASNAASGLPLVEDISGRSVDSNMSISPVAGSASATNNPFTSADEIPSQPTSSGGPLANPFLPALPAPTSAASTAAPSAFLFGATASAAAAGGAPVQDAASKPGLFASGGVFGASGSAPAFGGGNTPTFGSVAKAPAPEQGSGPKSGTSAFGLGNGPTSSSGFSFGASGGASFGAQSSPASGTGAASAAAPNSSAASSSSGFTFGGSAPLAFGAGSATAAGGAGAAAPAFGAPQQTAGALFGTSAPATAQQPAWNFAFGASQPGSQSAPAPAFGAASTGFGAGSTPAFGSAPAFGGSSGSAPAFGAMPAFGAQSAPAFGAQSAPAFGAQSAPAFGGAPAAAPASGFAFGGAFGAGQKQDGPTQAQPPFGSTHNQPAFGQAPAFGAQPAGQAANPFAQPGAPAFGGQQPPPAGAGNGGFPAPGGGLAGNSAGSMTLGVGEQKQGGANMARRKYKLKRSGGK